MSRDPLSTAKIRSGVTTQEIIDIALDNVGIDWTINGCTDFVWGVTNLAGAPFFDLSDKTLGGDPTRPDDVRYAVPHSAGIKSGTDNVGGDGWAPVYAGTSAAALKASLQPGDVVRVYAAGNSDEESLLPGGGSVAHSFVVVSVSTSGVEVVDNWNTTQIIPHSVDDIIAAFAPAGAFASAFVSRLDESYVAENFTNDLASNSYGDFSELVDTGVDGEVDLSTGSSRLFDPDAILLGSLLARASYGGSSIPDAFQGTWRGADDEFNYDDDYRGYIASLSRSSETWRLLDQFDLGMTIPLDGENFTAGGLYRSDENVGEALVAERIVNGERTVVMAFRGSDGLDAATGQTFNETVLRNYYEGMRPLINAVRLYSELNGIENVIVSGHSLGGTIADLFGLADADLFSGVNLSIVSLASAGIEPDITDYTIQLGLDLSGSTVDSTTGELTSLGFSSDVDHYFGITHSEDRVSLPVEIGPLTILLQENINADYAFTINLPNLDNSEGGGIFGAEHNSELYWTNVAALMSDAFFERLGNHQIVMGLTDYSLVSDLNGAILPSFQSYTGINNYRYCDDTGLSALLGSGGEDFILGLDGNDSLIGYADDDLLSGGAGEDQLDGRSGADALAGGAGRDDLTGGSESDVFFFDDDDYPRFASVNPDRVTDFNQGNSGVFSASEGDLIDLSGFQFATSTGFGTASTVRLRSIEASGGLPEGAILEVNTGDGIWRGIARLDNVTSAQSVWIALTDAQSTARTGTEFIVDGVGDGTSWSVSPGTQNVAEGDVTIGFTITRSGGSLEAETVYVSTVQTHGSYNDGDYVGRANVAVPFATGVATETFIVQINADAFEEAEETFGLIVQADPNDIVSTYLASATFTIEDGSTPSVSGDTYIGDGLDNTWSGTNNADLAFGNGSSDTLDGREGNDILFGGDGNDSIEGGSGDDVIVTGDGEDYVDAGSGNDYIDVRERGSRDTIIAGSGNDTIIVSSEGGSGDATVSVDGGGGVDFLIVEAGGGAETSSGYYSGYLRHKFGSDGPILTARSSFSDIETAVATGSLHHISTSQYRSTSHSWVSEENIEKIEYRGGDGEDLFLDWDVRLTTALGGGGRDTLYADWSAAMSDIVWNLTVDNDSRKTLSNGVEVQSIERVLLKTGSGNDNLVLGDQDDHVETGSGDDVIVTGDGEDYVDAGSGNDQIVYAGLRANFSMTTTGGVTTVIGATGTDTLVDVEQLVFDDQTISLVPNLPPTASPIDAGSVAENGGEVTIDLLGEAVALDSDGGTLGVANVSVTDQNGAAVVFGLTDATLTIDPTQFARALASGASTVLTVTYDVTDGQGGVTPNTGQLVVVGLGGPFTWYLDGDRDGFGVDDPTTNQTAYVEPAGTSDVAGDADDADPTVFPGAPEVNDGKDNDQDGAIDEDNTAPSLVDDGYAVHAGEVLTVAAAAGLLSNDSDADGDPIFVTSIEAPANGTINIAADGSFEYTPDAGFVGQEMLTYSVSDGTELAMAEVTIDVTNAAPTFTDAGPFAVAENTTAVGSVAAADPDGDTITYLIDAGADAAFFEIDSATGAIRFADAPDFEASADANGDNRYEVEVSASDGLASSAALVFVDIIDVEEDIGPTLILGGTDTQIFGTEGADILQPNAGTMKTTFGGGGADVFDFADTVHNGAREFRTILDYTVGEDMIDLGAGSVIHHAPAAGRVLLFIDQDFDVITVVGADSLDEISFA
ncbi:hypothetical protein BYZ73_20085 [Rhodovulum viride]|uniref:Cadherin domain-containing protein n=1 Tax=Rhodovulum viride TaxID=1231134 RepID=A0ABX9DB09_9RHOB|nr:Ig-like domain-containing protein [Rhodovulum viride]RAP39522.1 hypothetical protein BYZ73_20085 [Rhodovulum viride]